MILRPGMLWVTRCSGRMLRFGTNGFFGCGGRDGRERLTFKSCLAVAAKTAGNG